MGFSERQDPWESISKAVSDEEEFPEMPCYVAPRLGISVVPVSVASLYRAWRKPSADFSVYFLLKLVQGGPYPCGSNLYTESLYLI